MSTSKDAPIIDLGQEISETIYQDDSSHDILHNDLPTLNMYDIIGYTFFK